MNPWVDSAIVAAAILAVLTLIFGIPIVLAKWEKRR